jgi:hypothetical protein
MKDIFGKKPNEQINEENELFFSTLGPSGVGKTSYLACLYEAFNMTLPGFLYPDGTDTCKSLREAYDNLKLMGNSRRNHLKVEPKGEGTQDLREHRFTIQSRRHVKVEVNFCDYPGAWMNLRPRNASEKINTETFLELLRKSSVVIAAIDTPYLMDKRYSHLAQTELINECLVQSLAHATVPEDFDIDKLFLLVPIKCEHYMQRAEDAQILNAMVKESFSQAIRLTQNPFYSEHLALAILPVQTIGNVELDHFYQEKGTPIAQYKLSSNVFRPRDVEQPLLYAMSFLLNQYGKQKRDIWAKILYRLFGEGILEKLLEMLQKDMREDKNWGFEILHGRNLIIGD